MTVISKKVILNIEFEKKKAPNEINYENLIK